MLAATAVMTFAFAGSARATTITFSEFPVGTVVSNQYAGLGVLFFATGGDPLPVIANDAAMPTSPVLSPNPPFAGNFGFQFLSGATDVSFLSGFWDTVGTAVINVFSPSAVFLGTVTNAGTGVQAINLASFGVVGFVTFDSNADPAGGVIDSLQFESVPEPTTLLLLGSGLGFAAARRRLRSKKS